MRGVRRRDEAEFYNSRFCRERIGLAKPLEFVLQNWYLFAAAIASGSLLLMADAAAGRRAAAGVGGRRGAADQPREGRADRRQRAGRIRRRRTPSGAKNAPLATLETSRELPKNKSLPLVVVCPTGSRAPRALAVLKKLGYENARVLAGGLAAWRAANLPVEKTASA